jgi:hypothetical protein
MRVVGVEHMLVEEVGVEHRQRWWALNTFEGCESGT